MKVVIAILFVVASLTASAQRNNGGRGGLDGRIILRDGQSTVRISINERNDTAIRIRLLEEAVRDLQAQVYDLRDVPATRIVKMHVCSLKTDFRGTFIGKAQTQIEAEANARNSCSIAGAPFCSSTRVTCQIQEEVVAY